MIKELRIGNKGSFSDFGQCISKRTIGIPTKKSIKESVPFQDGSYDFSDINGEVAFNERDITYSFDIIGISMEEVERQKHEMLDWLMMVQNENIYDGYDSNLHFRGSYDSASWTEDWEQCELSVTFKCYPYAIRNSVIKKSFKLSNESNLIKIFNSGSHRITPKVITTGPLTITKCNDVFNFKTGTFEDDIFQLDKGINELIIVPSILNTNIEFQFIEEVF